MTGRLREELERIAESAPVTGVDPETWARARRSRLRDRALVLAAVAAVLVGIGAVPVALHHRGDAPVAGRPARGVPEHIWLVPDRMADRVGDGRWARDQVSSDLAVGRAAAAYLLDAGLPVVIGAGDGAYHLLDLPDFAGNDFYVAHGLHGGELGLALSPDGTELAYAYAHVGAHAGDRPIPSGIRVVDLVSGDVRTIPVSGGQGTVVSSIRWSPGSTWLVWEGYREDSWTRYSMGGSRDVAGVVSPAGDTSEALPPFNGNASVSYAVSDRGEVSVVGDSTRYVGYGPGATGPTQGSGSGSSTTVHLPGRVPLHAGASFTLAASYAGDTLLDLRVRNPHDRYQLDRYGAGHERVLLSGLDGLAVEPLGWTDADHFVARIGPARDGDVPSHLTSLALVTASGHPSYRVVGEIDTGVAGLTLATGLMTPTHPTVSRPEPDWPWTTERWTLTLGLPALALLLLAGTFLALRRRR